MEFAYIVNPESGRRVKVNWTIGKRVLRNYINQIGGQGSGHGVHLPSEFFGNSSGRYFESGDTLNLKPSAYGPQSPTSHGMPIGNNNIGPDLGPVASNGDQSGTQTGGRKKKRNSRNNKRNSQNNKRKKSRNNRRKKSRNNKRNNN